MDKIDFGLGVSYLKSNSSVGCLLRNSPRKCCALFFVTGSNLVYLIELPIWLDCELDFLSYHH